VLTFHQRGRPKPDPISFCINALSKRFLGGAVGVLCALEDHDVCPRKLEKSKSRKVEKFTCQEISARKVEKFEKIEKSKSRKVRKIRKIRFLTFCENFPWKSDKPRGFIHAQGFLWLFGCSFPVEWLVTFQGSRKLAISVSELDFVLLM